MTHLMTIKPCEGCKRPMRPKDIPLSAYPGTIGGSSGGLCVTCYSHRNRSTSTMVASVPTSEAQLATRMVLRRAGEDATKVLDMIGLVF